LQSAKSGAGARLLLEYLDGVKRSTIVYGEPAPQAMKFWAKAVKKLEQKGVRFKSTVYVTPPNPEGGFVDPRLLGQAALKGLLALGVLSLGYEWTRCGVSTDRKLYDTLVFGSSFGGLPGMTAAIYFGPLMQNAGPENEEDIVQRLHAKGKY
jgi:hypothetical protein